MSTNDGLLGDGFRAWFSDKLQPLYESAREHIEDGSTCPPVLVIYPADGGIPVVLPVTLEDNAHKNRVARIQRQLAAATIVKAAVLASEVWTVALDKEEGERAAADPEGIENHPARTEAMCWNAIAGERQIIALAAIERPANTLGPITFLDPAAGMMSGRMVVDGREH